MTTNSDYLSDWLLLNKRFKEWANIIRYIRKRSRIELVPQLLQELYKRTHILEWYVKKGNYQAIANPEKLITWLRITNGK
jgi:macrodomain Ter protein organizer (MatP/YcbG family)